MWWSPRLHFNPPLIPWTVLFMQDAGFPHLMDEDNSGTSIEKSIRAKRLRSIIRDLDSIARLLEQASTDSV